MSNLPQETIYAIHKEASDRADKLDVKNDYQNGYKQGCEDGHITGATEWAEMAEKHLIAALEAIIGKTMPVPNKADMIDIAKTALAKYKEVGNG